MGNAARDLWRPASGAACLASHPFPNSLLFIYLSIYLFIYLLRDPPKPACAKGPNGANRAWMGPNGVKLGLNGA